MSKYLILIQIFPSSYFYSSSKLEFHSARSPEQGLHKGVKPKPVGELK